MWMTINEDILRRVELQTKEKAKKEEEHVTEMDEVNTETKVNVVVDVWEAKLKVEDVENARSQNVAGWREALAKLTGKPIDAGQDPAEKNKGE